MDIQTSLIYGSIVIVCAVVVFAISIFGIKEKTYDEAIAEQRLIPSEHLLLGRSSKEKSKEKKVKKAAAGKKVKEKPATEEKINQKGSAELPATHERGHVEFEPDTEVISTEHPHQEGKKKKKKVKPILLNKDERSVIVDAPLLANHFEESLPKDDLLLKRRMSMENLGYDKLAAKGAAKSEKMSVPKPTAPVNATTSVAKTDGAAIKAEKAVVPKVDKVVVLKGEKATVPKADKMGVTKVEKAMVPVVEEVMVANVTEVEESAPYVPAVKEQRSGARKKKSEFAALQQMSGDREGVNVSLIVPLVQKSELSRSEIQILIDLLLNKQQGSAVANSEWIEGRQDPVVKLKKQLAEKEKALLDEQEASQAFQNKLKELRTELNTDRSRWRQMEEAAAAKHVELQHAATRFQHAQEAHKTEKNNLTQQIQQLQAKLNEDHAIMRKLQEDQGQAQGVMQQEWHGQRQQLELHMTHLNEQHKETEALLTVQLNQLHAQMQEQENVNVALRGDLQNARDNAIARDADNKMMLENIRQLKNEVIRQESIAQDLNRQLEEIHHINATLDHRINNYNHLESQLKFEKEQLLKEKDQIQKEKDQLLKELETSKESLSKVSDVKNEASRWQTEKETILVTVKNLQAEAQHAREEKDRLASKVTGLVHDSQQLREENESLAAQVTAVTERPAAEGRENGDSHCEEKEQKKDGSLQIDILLKQKEAEVSDLTSQIINYKTEISKLSNDCEAQRQKNNELRTKNWKAMDALAATEKSLETQLKETKKLVNESSTASRLEEQSITKSLLERLFPEVSLAQCATHTTWLEQFEKSALVVLRDLRAMSGGTDTSELEKQVGQLQGMVTHYKTIIQDTESLLKTLQQSAEETEAELEAVKEERDRFEQSLEEVLGAQEEKDRLLVELAEAQERDREMTKELTKLKSLVDLGHDGSHQTTKEPQHTVDKLNGVGDHHNVATNGSETESSVAEGGSGKK